MKRGFTLTEILVTLLILAIFATLAIPNFSKTREKNDERQAVGYLRAIRLAEMMHFAKTGSYAAATPSCNAVQMTSFSSNATVNLCLGTEISSGSYVFSVAADATTFTATATGAHTISVDQDGTFSRDTFPYSPN